MFQFDWSISLGNIVSLLVFASTAIYYLSAMRIRLDNLEIDLREIKDSAKDLARTIVESMITTGKVDAMDQRLNLLIQRVDKLYGSTQEAIRRA